MNILPSPWTLTINNSAAEKYQDIPNTALQGKTSITITYDLHGLMLKDGNASAIIFDQDGWKYVSLSKYGVNGKNGEQTVTIPIADFGLDLTKPLTGPFHVRLWYSGQATVDIKSVVLNQPIQQDPAMLYVALMNDFAVPGEEVYLGILAHSQTPIVAIDAYLDLKGLVVVENRPTTRLTATNAAMDGTIFKQSYHIAPGTPAKPFRGLLTFLRCKVPLDMPAGVIEIGFLHTPGSTTDSNIANENGQDILQGTSTVHLSVLQ